MNLALDIGNTLIKAAVFDQGQVVDTFKTESGDRAFVDSVLEAYPAIDSIILVSTRRWNDAAEEYMRSKVKNFVRFDASVPVPVGNLYGTPGTMGCDRLAAAVGANSIYPGANILIVDFGTAITIDVVSNGNFLGGNISPGAATRFRALHEFTSHLPHLAINEQTALIGNNSNEAIESGVVNGIVFEIEGYIERLTKKYENLRIIFTGGDGNFFAKRFKNTIFATYDLVVYGLNKILEHNADQKSDI